MKRIILGTIILFMGLLHISAQDDLYNYNKIDSFPKVTLDTTKTKVKKKRRLKNFLQKDYPSPKKAILLAIVPGMGQIYNKKYWKLPLVYSALGGVIASIKFNTNTYNTAIESLAIRNGEMSGDDPIPADFPDNAIVAQRNVADKNRQLSWIGLVGFYLISAGDAFVDAHLKDFNVDDDISFQPVFETGWNNQPVIGLGVRIPLGK